MGRFRFAFALLALCPMFARAAAAWPPDAGAGHAGAPISAGAGRQSAEIWIARHARSLHLRPGLDTLVFESTVERAPGRPRIRHGAPLRVVELEGRMWLAYAFTLTDEPGLRPLGVFVDATYGHVIEARDLLIQELHR